MMSTNRALLNMLVIASILLFALAWPWSYGPASAQAVPVIRYVKPGATGNCASWATACGLEKALTEPGTFDEIWATEGTYVPETTGHASPREATFQLKSNVDIFGGFAGTEAARDQRDPAAHITILSGDLNGDDAAASAAAASAEITGNAENSYHVVTGANDAVLDGVTITAGNANGGSPPNNSGGGMYTFGSSPALAGVIFTANTAGQDGGGMYNTNSSSPTLTGVQFNGNKARYGGGLYNNNSSHASLTRVTFTGNEVTEAGGGMMNWGGSNPTLTNVTFTGNSAIASSPSVGRGGGMYSMGSSPTLTNVIFLNNECNWDGGGMFSQNGTPVVTNVVFSGNHAVYGAGMYNWSSNSIVTNVTLGGNASSVGGGGLYNNASTPTLTNVIVWGNTANVNPQIDGSATITYSDIQGGWAGTGNINKDPMFVAVASGNLRLWPGSPAIDAGKNDAVPTAVITDLDGNPRIVDFHHTGAATVDMGAYEAQPESAPAVIYVDADAPAPGQDGASWGSAYRSLQSALAVAAGTHEIWVAEGTYYPGSAGDRDPTFQLKNNVAIYGGFAGTETSRNQRDPAAHATVLSGDLNGNDGDDISTKNDNAYHVVTGSRTDHTAILNGFTITGGNANGHMPHNKGGGMLNVSGSPSLASLTFFDNTTENAGGGMYNYASSPTLTSVIFSENSAAYYGSSGGGMYNDWHSNPSLTYVAFLDNTADNSGGGMQNDTSRPVLTDVTFERNETLLAGGGMYNRESSPILTKVTFAGNAVTYMGSGGGMYNGDSSSPVLTNVTFSGNSAANFGGGMNNWMSSSPILTNVTFSGNSAFYSGGIDSRNSSNPILTNVIVWGNTPAIAQVGGSADISYSDIQGGWSGEGNIDSDPFLGLLANHGGFTLTHDLGHSSPAIDAGSPGMCPATDQRGVLRPIDGDLVDGPRCDMGAVEYELKTFMPLLMK